MATYTVQKGDTLTGIAKKLGLPSYTQLSGYNKANPNLINPGLVLTYNSPAQGASTQPASTPSTATNPVTPTTNNSATALQSLIPTPAQSKANLAANIAAATVAPTPSAASYLNDPRMKTLDAALQAQLKQQIQSGQAQTSQDLASRGFLRSGQEITANSLQSTIAESQLALQEANYIPQLQAQDYQTNVQNAQAALQNQSTAVGLSQTDFNNMLSAINQSFTQQNTTAQAQASLLTNAGFTTLLTFAQSNPQALQILTQTLQQLGFNVTE